MIGMTFLYLCGLNCKTYHKDLHLDAVGFQKVSGRIRVLFNNNFKCNLVKLHVLFIDNEHIIL